MGLLAEYKADLQLLRFYESTTARTAAAFAPLVLREHFLQATISSGRYQGAVQWTSLDTSATGDTAPALVSSGRAGQMRIKLDATDEAQLSGITHGDNRNFRIATAGGFIWEATLTLTSADMTGIRAVWGVASNHNATFDSIQYNAWFSLDGSLALKCETDDDSTNTDDIDAATTLVTGTQYVFTIELIGTASIVFKVNGARVAAGTTFAMPNADGVTVQPYFAITKPSGTTLATIDIDECWAYGIY